MRKIFGIVIIITASCSILRGQHAPVNRQQFFLDDSVIEVTFTTDLKKLRTEKKVPTWQPAKITMRFSDTFQVSESIQVQPRGIFRKSYCDMASLYLNFKSTSSPMLSPLKKLKLVGSCNSGNTNEEFLLKEYLTYKIYNLLSVMSYRVRLLHIDYRDSQQKIKPYSQYAFLIEDTKDMADRNNCVEIKNRPFANEATNKYQITFVSIFEYMIGNTDWAVGNYHNIKLMTPKNDTLARPYAIPYDFDYAGLIDAPYAVPAEIAGTQNVRERFYMGYPRTIDELQTILDVFREKKGTILLTINDFPWLSDKVKKEMTRYIEGFYQTISSKNSVKAAFIDNAFHN